MMTNTDGLSNKMNLLKLRVTAENPDFIAICETWFQNDPLNHKFYPDECLQLHGYNSYRYDNNSAVRGGILLYIKPMFDGGVCKEMNKKAENFEESAWHWLRLPTGTKTSDKLLLGCVYRKGSTSMENNKELYDVIEECCKMNNLVTLCGDFNYPGISWNTWQGSHDHETQFLDAIDDNNLVQHVKDFTRKRGTDLPSLLDLVLTDDQQNIDKPVITAGFGESDHAVICWNSTFRCNEDDQAEFVPTPNYYKGNYKKIRANLQEIDWDNEFTSCNDVNDMVKTFEGIINVQVEQFIPKKKKPNNNKQAPWITFKLLRCIKRKYHSWKRFQETKTHERYMAYVKERRKASKKIRTAKKEFEKRLAKLSKTNPKAFYSYANTKKKSATNYIRLKKAKVPSDLSAEDEFTSSDKETTEELNKYFSSVFTNDIDDRTLSFNYFVRNFMNEDVPEPMDLPYEEGSKLQNINITDSQVEDLLKKIDPNKSGGDDKIHPMILKECAEQLGKPLQKIFQCSVNSGIFPDSWKTATITPLYKSEERDLPGNYRPISITSQVGKILEKIVRREMLAFITSKDLLSPHQHGFCGGKSCMTNLLETLEDITASVDAGIPVDEIFLDFRKAFDKVSHAKLIYKLHRMGFEDSILCWIESFLSNRRQRVKLNADVSSWADVTSGVPQGSVLGPLLFLVFINDLPGLMKTNCKLFADASKLYAEVPSFEEHKMLQEDLNKCDEWATQWGMEFHPKKCKVLHFGKHNPGYTYHLGGISITPYEE